MKRISLFLIFSLFIFVSNAQLLWKITGNKLKKPSYLFATHHLVSATFLDSVPNVYKSFNECETVVGEMVMNNIDAGPKIAAAAMLPNGKSMKDLLSEEDYKMIDQELLKTLKIGLNDLARMQPQFILTLYTVELYKIQYQINTDLFLDSYFQLIGNEKEMKIIGLETIEKQLETLFTNWSLERQTEILIETFKNKDTVLKGITDIARMYKKGDLSSLELLTKGTNKSTDLTPEEYNLMVDSRNAEWLTLLPEIMQNSSCFIAVGAAHLPGEKGLIRLLENAGYKLKPVN